MTLFKLNRNYSVVCEYKSTRNGFTHIATILNNGLEINKVKVNYLNRTWESYEYVLRKAIDSIDLSKRQYNKFKKKIVHFFC